MSKFSLKPCVLLVSVAMLSACQSVAPQQQGQTEIGAKALFSNNKQSLSYGAKTQFVRALETHLAKERYAVSTSYYQALPMSNEGADKDSESIWTSAMKVSEYKRNPASNPLFEPYRTAGDYLYPKIDGVEVDKNAELYLRYDDEKSGKIVATVSREVGMSEEYGEISDEIDILATQSRECIGSNSHDLDELIKENPNITDQNAKVKKIKQNIKNCQTDFDKQVRELTTKAQGYQKSDIKHLQMCVSHYQKGINDILKPTRIPKSLSGDDYDHYDIVYENYRLCTDVYKNSVVLEPRSYVENGTNQRVLDMIAGTKACKVQAVNVQQTGDRSYRTDGQFFLQSHFDSLTCIDEHLHEMLETDELPKPVTNIEGMREREDEQESLAYELKYEDEYKKYRGLSGWIQAYRELKNTDKNDKHEGKDDESEIDLPPIMGSSGNMVAMMLDHLKQTPEQVIAQNLYQYNHTTLTNLSHHNPASKRLDVLWSYDFESPTAVQSVQLPVSLDFGAGVMNADVSALLPIVAAVAPKHAPLPKDVPHGQMAFKLPDEIAKKIPTDVIYGAIQRGVLMAYEGLPDEKFTPIDISGDDFAKSVGAKRAIKIELGSKELGRFLGAVAKTVAQDLKTYVDNHAEHYPDTIAKKSDKANNVKKGQPQTDKIKKAIDDFATLSGAYRIGDVGGLFQIIEGIAPFSMDNINYVYLDATGNIIAMQNLNTIDENIQSVRMQTVSQVRYDKSAFDKHELSTQFANTFATKPRFDGATWAKNAIEETRLKNKAREARDWYEYESDDDEATTND
ncbi:hypothetical protein [Moraxella oblonga]|uniref:hypothetical protein n=1 Tax=Moraxella oblonga TaxID=200413 RepID=UPI00082AE38F|nr:hypothetical protein [Moraxella oblonga]